PQRTNALAGLGVVEPQIAALEVDRVPTEREDLVLTAARQGQQADSRYGEVIRRNGLVRFLGTVLLIGGFLGLPAVLRRGRKSLSLRSRQRFPESAELLLC